MKEKMAKLLKELGLDFSTLNRLLYAHMLRSKKVPFEIGIEKGQPFTWEEGTAEEEDQLWKDASLYSMKDMWDDPADDEWDEILKDLPDIRDKL